MITKLIASDTDLHSISHILNNWILGDEIYWFLWKTKKFPYSSGGRMYLESQCIAMLCNALQSNAMCDICCDAAHICSTIHMVLEWCIPSHNSTYVTQSESSTIKTQWAKKGNTMWHLDQEKWQKSQLQCWIAIVCQWLAVSIGYNNIGSSLIVTRDVVLNVV